MIAKTMLAAVYRGPGRIVLEKVPVPEPGPGEMLVRVLACGVCGTDLKKIEFGLQPPPRVFGHEIAGTVAALGSGLEGWCIGERVVVHHHVPCGDCFFCARKAYAHCPTYRKTGTSAGFEPAGGGFAEYLRVADWIVRRGVIRIPEGVPPDEASLVEPLNTCLKGLRAARAEAGETVLVLGAGPIGLLFCQLGRSHGLRLIAAEPRRERRAAALRCGAETALDPGGVDLPTSVRESTGGRGADLTIVAVAQTGVVREALESTRPGGRVLLFAQTRMGDELAVDAGQICALEKTLLGSYSADVDLQEEAAELIFGRRLAVGALITHRFPLAEIEAALDLVAHPRDGSLKVVVNP